MDEFASIVDRITGVADKAHVNMVFGEPKEVHGRVLIPVAEITYGFGLGLGSDADACTCECDDDTCCCDEGECECTDDACCEDEEVCACDDDGGGFGGGAGARVRPIAYIDVGPEGAKVVPVQDEQKIALMGIAMGMWCVGWIGLVLKSLLKK